MALGICQSVGKTPIINCQVNPERNFAFIEFGCAVPAAPAALRCACAGPVPVPCMLPVEPNSSKTHLGQGQQCCPGHAPTPRTSATRPSRPRPRPPRSDVADATAALQLDMIPFRGQALKIKRPKDYVHPYGVGWWWGDGRAVLR